MASWAKVGAKCVCVEPGDWDNINGDDLSGPSLGEICTIISVSADDVDIWVTLAEYSRNDEFRSEAFRPIVTKTQEQDIEMFLRIANDTPFHVTIDEETNV